MGIPTWEHPSNLCRIASIFRDVCTHVALIQFSTNLLEHYTFCPSLTEEEISLKVQEVQ